MATADIQAMIELVEQLLREEDLCERIELAIKKLLNAVEALTADKKLLADEVERLKAQLEKKKNAKTTASPAAGDASQRPPDHSSEKRRRKRERQKRKRAIDRRSFKDLTIHETKECPVDPALLPPDAVRLEDEIVIVQDIEIKPKNTKFQRHVFYSPSQRQTYRGPLPPGCDHGDFSAALRALIIALKYCGNMSEPKIGEFLENFDVQVSSGSLSNILTNSAANFEQDYHDLFVAGLSSTPYQQTDDTSARVKGQFWHTHILCNPFYTFYSTRPHKDRLAVLSVLQNTDDLQFRFGGETLDLLGREFLAVPAKWQQRLAELGDAVYSTAELKTILDGWFGAGNKQLRLAIEQAAAITFYRHQRSVPVVGTLVCDDAGQFKLLTDRLALCWIHEGRHYEKLSPVVGRHATALGSFRECFWDYYALPQDYRAGPTAEWASRLRLEFDELFSTRTGYDALDDRIAKTLAKREELLTVLSEPAVPLHNNASELGARVSARRRDVSLHSRSERGARAMDIFTTLVQTSKKLGVSAYSYLRDRLCGTCALPALSQRLTQAAASS
jgi:Transposase IS66 family